MTFDTIKLDKGLYSSAKGFTASLEDIDPSANYIGTELEGLDAYQRQLKRFDIKVSGENSDPISKFFATTDSAALFPEFVSRAVNMGIRENDNLSKLVATTTQVDSRDYRSIDLSTDELEYRLPMVSEGEEFQETHINVQERLAVLKKRGSMLIASYEAIKFQKLDLFAILLKKLGMHLEQQKLKDCMLEIERGDNRIEIVSIPGGLTYENLLEAWKCIQPYNLTTIAVNVDTMIKIAKIDEFKDANSASTFSTTGSFITPFGAEIVIMPSLPDDKCIVLEKNSGIEHVKVGGIVTEYDKLIDRQLERATISEIYGFSIINKSAVKFARFNEV